MQIVMALESFFPYSHGGTEKSVLQLSHFLLSKGHQVCVLTPDDDGKKNISSFEGISIHYFSSSLLFSKEQNYTIQPADNLDSFKAKLKKLSPDIFHLHSFSPALNSFHIEAAKSLGIKTFFTPRLANNFCINNGELVKNNIQACNAKVTTYKCLYCSLKRNNHLNTLKRHLVTGILHLAKHKKFLTKRVSPYYLRAYAKHLELKRTARNTNSVIAISDWVRKAFHINGFTNVTQIDQGINFESHTNLLSTYKPVVLTYIGRFSREKGIDILINTLGKIKNHHFHLNIVTFEDNINQDYFNETIIRNGLEDKITFHFNQSTSQIYKLLSHSHWLCLLSRIRDTAPRVIHEAFACQVPSIVSQHIPDFINHNINGIRVNINNEKDLLSTFKTILTNHEFWLNIKNNIKPPRTIETVGHEHLSMYNKHV
jgi:glycosyltransferase involved in cell wall biosynthesis